MFVDMQISKKVKKIIRFDLPVHIIDPMFNECNLRMRCMFQATD